MGAMRTQHLSGGPAPAQAGAGPIILFIYQPADRTGTRLHLAWWESPVPPAESPGRLRDGERPEIIMLIVEFTGRGCIRPGRPGRGHSTDRLPRRKTRSE